MPLRRKTAAGVVRQPEQAFTGRSEGQNRLSGIFACVKQDGVGSLEASAITPLVDLITHNLYAKSSPRFLHGSLALLNYQTASFGPWQ
jgi:hypothetical protein